MVKARPRRAGDSSGADGVTLTLRIQPRASKNGLSVMEDGSYKVRLTAPPVDGAANEALIAFLAKTLQVSKSQVEIVSGQTARDKRLRITGIGQEDARQLLNEAAK